MKIRLNIVKLYYSKEEEKSIKLSGRMKKFSKTMTVRNIVMGIDIEHCNILNFILVIESL